MNPESTPNDPGPTHGHTEQPPAATELYPVDLAERRQKWLNGLKSEFLKLEPLFALPEVVPTEGRPKWVENVEREVGSTLYPLAKLKLDHEMTPKRMGALIGHSCASAVWMIELAHNSDNAKTDEDISKLTTEQLQEAEKMGSGLVNEYYSALRRFAKRALCSCVNQVYEDMRDFLLGYAEAFSHKPKTQGMADVGTTALELYMVLLICWPIINRLGSVHQLHQVLTNSFGSRRTGDLKRIEKMCQRIELRYRKPGRPKK